MPEGSPPRIRSTPWLVAAIALGLLASALTASAPQATPRLLKEGSSRSWLAVVDTETLAPGTLLGEASEGAGDLPVEPTMAGATKRFPTVIRSPHGPPHIGPTPADPQGRLGEVACSTCHSVRDPNLASQATSDLDQFHQNMPISHGQLTCYSCHNPDDTDTLRLANSTAVAYSEVMKLCAQCHSRQAESYEHGLHGGMTGYWDLTRGPRARNNCIDCHDPHVPAFPKMLPTFKPRDRFLKSRHGDASDLGGANSPSSPSENHHE